MVLRTLAVGLSIRVSASLWLGWVVATLLQAPRCAPGLSLSLVVE